MNVLLSIYEPASVMQRLSMELSSALSGTIEPLNEEDCFSICHAMVSDYIADMANYKTPKGHLERYMRSKFAWWENQATTNTVIKLAEVWNAAAGNFIKTETLKFKTKDKPQLHREKFTGQFYEYVLMEVDDLIRAKMRELIPEKTWMVWLEQLTGDTVVLEQYEDFRVLDWERRMGTGEWTVG